MNDFVLSAEQLAIRDCVREFVTRELKPLALDPNRLEAGRRLLGSETVQRASRLGLRTLGLAEELGGAGANHVTSCLVAEELAVGDVDVATVFAETSALAGLLFHGMTPAQRDRFLPRFLTDDDYHLAFVSCASELDAALGPNYHRDVDPTPTIDVHAVRFGGGELIVNGRQNGIANAPLARLFAVQAMEQGDAQSGPIVVLLPRDMPGLAVEACAHAWLHGACGNVVLSDCRVPAENIVVASGNHRLGSTTQSADYSILQQQAINLGIGRAAFEAAIDYAKLRVQGGRPIVEHQAIGAKLAEMAIKLEVARNTIWRAAWTLDHGEAASEPSRLQALLPLFARVFTSEAVLTIAKEAAEIFGAMGVMRDMPLQKYVHDAHVCLYSGIGNREAKLRIAEALADYRRTRGG